MLLLGLRKGSHLLNINWLYMSPVGRVVLQVVASKVPSQRFRGSCLGYFSPTKPSWTPKPHRHTWTWWCGWRVFGAQPDEAYFGIFWATLNFSCGFLWQTCLQTTKNRGICFEAPGTFEVWHFKAHLLVLVLQIIADSCPEISYTSSRHQTSAVLPSPLTDPWTQTDRPAPISRWFSIAPMHGSCYCRQEPWIKILGNQNERHLWHTGLFSTETYLNVLKPHSDITAQIWMRHWHAIIVFQKKTACWLVWCTN